MKYKKLFTKLADISLSAGKAVMDIYSGDVEVELKEDNSPLTAADLAAHTIISEGLRTVGIEDEYFPVISEEGEIPDYEQRKAWNSFWLIDPLDGTKEFISRNGEFTVNIALIRDDYPYLGVVYLPVTEILYFGGPSCGAYRTTAADTELSAAESLPLAVERDRSILTAAGSRSHRTAAFDDWVDKEAQKRACSSVEIITAGSSLKFCLAAEGAVDVYPRFGPTMEWDTAAAHAVAEGAGKKCLQPDGSRMVYNKPVMKNAGFIVV